MDMILARFGDMTLKGKNKRKFVKQLMMNLDQKVAFDEVTITRMHDRVYIHLNGVDYDVVMKRLQTVSGLSGFSPVVKTDKAFETIAMHAVQLMQNITPKSSFKVESKRADKTYPMQSPEISRNIAGVVLKNHPTLQVDVHNPDCTLHVEVRKDHALVYTNTVQGLGGFPVGIAGKGILMMSGGIDSAVAGFLAMKQGVDVEGMHFESTPLTSVESVQKVIDLAKKLARYAVGGTFTLHIVPFTNMHQILMKEVPSPYHITIMRRMMVRMADQFAARDYTPVLISGESIGQVASQTLDSLYVQSMVAARPIIRPLACMDKIDITRLAKKIDTYAISILPFDDCCNVYVPNQVATNPRDFFAKRYERLFDYKSLIKDALTGMVTLTVHKDTTLDLRGYGLTVKEAFEAMKEHDHND